VAPVSGGGVGWTVAGLVIVQAMTEMFLVPALAASTPGGVGLAVVLIVGTATRVVLGGLVAWRLLRVGIDDSDDIVRTVVAGVLVGLVVTWIAGWLVVRPHWGLGQWAAELGRFVVAVGLWVPPCGWGAQRFARSDLAQQLR
jgi:hypothetical protein